MYDCEFSRYHEYLYLPGDTEKKHPFVEGSHRVSIGDLNTCSHGVDLCSLTAGHRTCNHNKVSCPRYKKYLERKSQPKLPMTWNHETKRREHGIPIDYNNWNM